MHEPADALHQIGRPEPFLDQYELDASIQSLAVFRIEIERGDDDDRDVPPASLLLQGCNDRKAVYRATRAAVISTTGSGTVRR